MNKNQYLSVVAIVIIIGVGAFYGGMKYDANKVAQKQLTQGGRGAAGSGFGGGANGGQRGTVAGQGQGGGQRGGMQGGANGASGDFASGQVISKDDTSITIKGRDGSSKIVFFSGSTSIDKSISGATSDLSVGAQVNANGKNNPDGSLAAQNIQIRPSQPAGQN